MFAFNFLFLLLVCISSQPTCITLQSYGIIFCHDISKRTTYAQANSHCQTDFGTTLARVDSSLKTQGIQEAWTNPSVSSMATVFSPSWVGLKRTDSNSQWLWEDGVSDTSYHNWDIINNFPTSEIGKNCAVANGIIPQTAYALRNFNCTKWTWSWVCNAPTLPVLTCPSGTLQIGSRQYADISGCGIEGCSARYSYSDINACKTACQNNQNCAGFSWASIGGDKDHLTTTVCTLYDTTNGVSDTGGPNQIFCKMTTPSPTPSPTFTDCYSSENFHFCKSSLIDQETARSECKSKYGTSLATITSQSLTNEIESLFNTVLGSTNFIFYSGWIGINNVYNSNTWTWDDGRVHNESEIGLYNNWCSGCPFTPTTLHCTLALKFPNQNHVWRNSICAASASAAGYFCNKNPTYPEPGKKYIINGTESFTLNNTVKWTKAKDILSCNVEYIYDETKNFTILSSNSYIEMYNNNNILSELEVDGFLLEHPSIMKSLPVNCSKIPVVKIKNIEYNNVNNVIKIYITEPNNIFEYFNHLDVDMKNVTLMDIGEIPDPTHLYHTRDMMRGNNISNYSIGYGNKLKCGEYDTTTGAFIKYVDSSNCNPNVPAQRGSKLGTNGFKNINFATTKRMRRLGFWDDVGDFFKNIAQDTFNWIQDLGNTIREFANNFEQVQRFEDWVKKFINFLKGRIDERLDFGISLKHTSSFTMDAISNHKFKPGAPLPSLKDNPSTAITKSAKNKLKAITLDGTFRFEAGADITFQVYLDFKARYDLGFGGNPDFDYMELKFGAEAYANTFFNFVLDGKLQLTYLIYQKTKSKWYLIGGVVPVYVRTGIHFEVDIALQTSVSFSANAGLQRIFIEYGYKFDGSSWTPIGSSYNLDFNPYFNYGYTIGGKDEHDCLDVGLSVIPNVRLSFALYETLEVHLQLALVKKVSTKYPSTCSSTAACELTDSQIATSTSLKLVVNIIPIISLLGAPLLIVPLNIISLPIYNLGPYCNTVFIPDPYYGCCGSPGTLHPTPNPVPAPTFNPTNTQLTIVQGSVVHSGTPINQGGGRVSYPYEIPNDYFMCGALRDISNTWAITPCTISGVRTNPSDQYGITLYPSNGKYIGNCNSDSGIQSIEIYKGMQLISILCNKPSTTNSYLIQHDQCTWSNEYDDQFTYNCNDGIITGITYDGYSLNTDQWKYKGIAFKCCKVKRV